MKTHECYMGEGLQQVFNKTAALAGSQLEPWGKSGYRLLKGRWYLVVLLIRQLTKKIIYLKGREERESFIHTLVHLCQAKPELGTLSWSIY